MKRYKEDYGRYTKFELPPIEECTLGDIESFQDSIKEKYPNTDVCRIWEKLENFLRGEINAADQNGDENAVITLKEILYWTEKRDAYSVTLLLRISWEQIKDLFVCGRCTDEVMNFMRYLHSFMQ